MSDLPATYYLRIDLEQDVVLSATAASAGLHETLAHIPGSALLGVAAKAYSELGDLAWPVFHAGGVRFGNALPFDGDQVYVPRPMTLPWEKSDPRDVFIADDGSRLHPQRRFRRRTAINPLTGQARKTALFGYTSLRAGQSFVSRLAFSAECLPAQPIVLRALTAGPVFLGRSRQTEYGKVRIISTSPPREPSPGPVSGTLIRLCAVSDCAFPGGGFPQPLMLGLPPTWQMEPAESAIGWRRYAPFNLYRNCFDPERIVLEQGSVLAFKGSSPLDAGEQATLRATLAAGVGLFVGEGLGVMLAEPALLKCASGRVINTEAEAEAPEPGGALFGWLLQRHADSRLDTLVRRESRQYQQAFVRMYRDLWREGAVEGRSHAEAAPGRAQWGSVRAEASRPVPHDVLLHRLFTASDAVCAAGTGAAPWKCELPFRQGGEPGTAAALLRQAMDLPRVESVLDTERQKKRLADELARRIVADLATQMPRVIDELERGAA